VRREGARRDICNNFDWIMKESELRGFGHAADTDAAIEVVRALGVDVRAEDGTVRIAGRGLRGLTEPDGPLDCGNAGTVLRLTAGVLAGQDGRFELVGDESLAVGREVADAVQTAGPDGVADRDQDLDDRDFIEVPDIGDLDFDDGHLRFLVTMNV